MVGRRRVERMPAASRCERSAGSGKKAHRHEPSQTKGIVHPDFHYLTSIESQLKGYNACFFCLGVSSVGMTKDDYYKQTYLLTLNFATTLGIKTPTWCFAISPAPEPIAAKKAD